MKQIAGDCIMKEVMSVNETVREALAIALLKLMKSQEFAKIAVSDIVRVAGVGRSSFYRNFDSKEDLICSYITDLYRERFESSEIPVRLYGSGNIEEFLTPRFNFIKEHEDIFKTLHRQNMLYNFFIMIENDIVPILCGHNAESPYIRAMFSGSCAGVARLWIEHDFAESVEEMVNLFAYLL